MGHLPKLSYILLSHNREKYIRAAVESAFAQEYEGELEYIFSDDCSTDRTFEIIKECVAAYKGNRRVVVTQTPRNVHLAGNTNHAVQFATGDFVVRADDDDLSSVDRCRIVGELVARYPGCSCVQTGAVEFYDAEEEKILQLAASPRMEEQVITRYDVTEGYDGVSGLFMGPLCNKAWSIEVYRRFSPLPQEGYYVDDLICQYRANVLGFYVRTSAVTVMIRKASGNMSSGGNDGSRGYESIMRLEKFNDKYSQITYGPLVRTIEEISAYMKRERPEDFEKASVFFQTLEQDMEQRRLMQTYWQNGTLNRLSIRRKLKKKGLFSLLRCLPMPVFAALLSTYRFLRRK